MELINDKRVCHQEGCKILEGGSCLEGIDVTKDVCPHFYLESDNIDSSENNKINESQTNNIKLFTGKEMTFSETAIITNNNDVIFIAIVGESKSGKTTLLAEYFINFQKGPFYDYYFAGSMTQIGFEERIFLATVGSKARRPDTFRTLSKEFNFLHLALKQKNKLQDNPIHYIISDISGERFREAKVSSASMKELHTLKSADHILFLINGQKLADKTTRSLTIEDAKTFIQKALDEGIFNESTNLKIAVSKWDYLEQDLTFNYNERIVNGFNERFKSRLSKLSFIKIAARSHITSLQAGLGLNDLLQEWEVVDIQLTENKVQIERTRLRAYNNYTFPLS